MLFASIFRVRIIYISTKYSLVTANISFICPRNKPSGLFVCLLCCQRLGSARRWRPDFLFRSLGTVFSFCMPRRLSSLIGRVCSLWSDYRMFAFNRQCFRCNVLVLEGLTPKDKYWIRRHQSAKVTLLTPPSQLVHFLGFSRAQVHSNKLCSLKKPASYLAS